MSDINHFLSTTLCFEYLEADLPHLGRVSPYIFRLPCPLSAIQLRIIGSRLAAKIASHTNHHYIHIIGIASRGIPMAAAVAQALDTEYKRNVVLSTIGCNGSIDHVGKDKNNYYSVLIDNSISTGATANDAVKALQSISIRPQLFGIFFDREELDVRGEDIHDVIRSYTGCQVIAAFQFREVLLAIQDPEKKLILMEYARLNGNQEIKSFLSSTGTDDL